MALTKPPPHNHCDDPSTPLHTLDCEHIIKPPSSPSSPVCFPAPKSLCSTNCTRSIYTTKPQIPLSWIKRQENLHAHPFICPACIEDRIRSQYPRYLEERRRGSGAQRLTDDVETNVQMWTYESVLEAAAQGGRICEAADRDDERGLFRIKYLEGFKALRHRKDTLKRVWNIRDVREELEVEEREKVTLDQDVDMDSLVEQLSEAKIAIAQDSAVDDLAEGVSGL